MATPAFKFGRITWSPVDRMIAAYPGADKPVVECATKLTRTGGLSYWDMVRQLPTGYRISRLEEIGYLISGSGIGLGENGHGNRRPLKDELYGDLLRGEVVFWEWTEACLRPTEGAQDFRTYQDRDSHGRVTFRADFYLGESLISEGVPVPEGRGGKIVEWDERLWLPKVTTDDEDAPHAAHFHFDPTNSEAAILLCRGKYVREEEPCLEVLAMYRRSLATGYGACRLFLRA